MINVCIVQEQHITHEFVGSVFPIQYMCKRLLTRPKEMGNSCLLSLPAALLKVNFLIPQVLKHRKIGSNCLKQKHSAYSTYSIYKRAFLPRVGKMFEILDDLALPTLRTGTVSLKLMAVGLFCEFLHESIELWHNITLQGNTSLRREKVGDFHYLGHNGR